MNVIFLFIQEIKENHRENTLVLFKKQLIKEMQIVVNKLKHQNEEKPDQMECDQGKK